MRAERLEGIWVLFCMVVLFILALIAPPVVAQTEMPDQRTHWDLMVAEVDLVTMKIIKEVPASPKNDYSKAACMAFTEVLEITSKDGRYALVFACVPTNKTDT